MSNTMHDLLASAVDGRERSLARGTTFADEHRAPVRRTIQARRVATYAGMGTVAAIATVSAGYGAQAWSASPATLFPGGGASTSSSAQTEFPSLAKEVSVTLVQVPYDYSVYEPRENDWIYVYYASLGVTDMIPFPGSGLWYPGIPDVPSDAVVVALHGNSDRYDLAAQGMESDIGAFPGWTVPDDGAIGGDLIGDRSAASFDYTPDGQNATITWDVIGDVSSTTRWGIHYFMLNGDIVTEVEGRSNPDAIEVTAMFDPAMFVPAMANTPSSS